MHTSSTPSLWISPQRLSVVEWLWTRFPNELHVSSFPWCVLTMCLESIFNPLQSLSTSVTNCVVMKGWKATSHFFFWVFFFKVVGGGGGGAICCTCTYSSAIFMPTGVQWPSAWSHGVSPAVGGHHRHPSVSATALPQTAGCLLLRVPWGCS